MELIRGTTPTIIFSFDTIQAANISVAVLCVKQSKSTVIEKELSDGLVSEGKLLFTLSQEDTLKLNPSLVAKIILDWKTSAGVRGRSNIVEATVTNPGKEEVL